MKKLILSFLGIASLLLIGMGLVARAAPVTPITGGGTGTSTIPSDGYLLIGKNGQYIFIASSSLGGGGGSTTINGYTGNLFQLLAGSGITSTIVNGSTTFTLNLGSGCSGTQFVATISPTGTITCATPSGGASSTNVYGTNGVTVVQVGVNATASINEAYGNSWTVPQTFVGILNNGNVTTTNESVSGSLYLFETQNGSTSDYHVYEDSNDFFRIQNNGGTQGGGTDQYSVASLDSPTAPGNCNVLGDSTANSQESTYSLFRNIGTSTSYQYTDLTQQCYPGGSHPSVGTVMRQSTVGASGQSSPWYFQYAYATSSANILNNVYTWLFAQPINATNTASGFNVVVNGTTPNGTFNVSGTLAQTSVVNSLGLLDSTGKIVAFSGNTCGAGSAATSISATGTLTCSSFVTSTLGNWQGTWQGVNSTTFYLATNPSNFIALTNLSATSPISYNNATGVFSCPTCITTSTNNFGGLTGNGTSTWIPVYSASGTLQGYANLTWTSSTNTLYVGGNIVASTTGNAELTLSRGATSSYATTIFGTTSTNYWQFGLQPGNNNFTINDANNGGNPFLAVINGSTTIGNSGTGVGVNFATAATASTTLTVNQTTTLSGNVYAGNNFNASGTISQAGTALGACAFLSTCGSGGGSGTVTTSTALTSGQIAFGTGGSSIGTSASFTIATSTGNLTAPTGTFTKVFIDGATSTNCLTDLFDPGTCVNSFNGNTGIINYNVIGSGVVTTTVSTSGGNTTTTFSCPTCGTSNLATTTPYNAGSILVASTTTQISTAYPSSTNIFYVDGNRTDSYPVNGSYLYPYKTFSSAIASSTGSGPYAYFLAPATYVDGAPDTLPNVPFIIYGNESTYVAASGVTFPNSFDIYDLTIAGNVTESDTSTQAIHQFNNGVITGNTSIAGLGTLEGEILPVTTTTLTVANGAITNTAGSVIDSNVQVNQGSFNANDDLFTASNTGYEVNASGTGGEISVFASQLVNTSGNGLNVQNGATSTPNAVYDTSITIGASATSTVTAGSAATSFCSNGGLTKVTGAFVPPTGTNWLPCYDEIRDVLNYLDVATNTSPGLAKLYIAGQAKFAPIVDATSSNATTSVDFSQSERQMIVLGTATTTLYVTNTENGDSDALKLCQDGTGSRTVTWAASSTNVASAIDWGTAGAPTLSTGANKCDWFTFLTMPKDTSNASSVVDGFYGQNGFTN